MYLKQIVVACLATALAGGAMAQQLTLKSGYPESYVVQKGDTLWDISGQYLAEPWLWPRLWNINPQIANPHWIYPGDVLHLSWVNGERCQHRKDLLLEILLQPRSFILV